MPSALPLGQSPTTKRSAETLILSSTFKGTLIHYPVPPHLSDAYVKEQHLGSFSITEQIARDVLSLPISPHMSDEEVMRVIEVLQVISTPVKHLSFVSVGLNEVKTQLIMGASQFYTLAILPSPPTPLPNGAIH
ncbi:hypothetical protein SD81_035060 [Tolypothrix campylonemoides VB511288]|nr:hypothetical protein SD81_035060 [Tolypothrix campylonemoides VB511288]